MDSSKHHDNGMLNSQIFLLNNGFRQSSTDYSLFIKKNGGSIMCLLVYVDDIILVGNCSQEIDSFKQVIDKQFKLKDLGDLKYFQGYGIFVS